MVTPVMPATLMVGVLFTAWLIPPTATQAIAAPLRYVAMSFTRSFRTRNMLDLWDVQG
jgi:hypothetical protein